LGKKIQHEEIFMTFFAANSSTTSIVVLYDATLAG